MGRPMNDAPRNEPGPTPDELQAMLADLALDPDTRASIERLLEATLAYLAAQEQSPEPS